MATGAGGGCVFARQREARGSMVEPSAGPLVYVVARLTVRGEPGRLMIHRTCLLELSKVATGTSRVQSDVDSGCGVGVTGIARERAMRA